MKTFQFLFLTILFVPTFVHAQSVISQSDDSNLELVISNSSSFNPNIVHGKISKYRISISGDDIKSPIVKEFKDVTQNILLNAPAGANRSIVVEAINPYDSIIRRAKKDGITILDDQLSQVDLTMNSVPIFANLYDKAARPGSRLGFTLFGEPGSKLTVAEVQNNARNLMPDKNSQKDFVNTNNDGFFVLAPRDFDLGQHTFEVRDENSGESSVVRVTLYKHSRPGLSISAGGNGHATIIAGAVRNTSDNTN